MMGLGVFARAPVPGATKTRLARALGEGGDEAAARLHRAFLRDLLERLTPLGRVVLFVAGDPAHPAFRAAERDHGVILRPQRAGDLGQRMAGALDELLAESGRAFVVGSDLPTLPARIVRATAAHPAEVVLTPARDGGYVLVGGSRVPCFDGVPWSVPTTLRETLRVNPGAGLTEPWYDVDDGDDLELLRLHLDLDPDAAPHTAAALRRLAR